MEVHLGVAFEGPVGRTPGRDDSPENGTETPVQPSRSKEGLMDRRQKRSRDPNLKGEVTTHGDLVLESGRLTSREVVIVLWYSTLILVEKVSQRLLYFTLVDTES